MTIELRGCGDRAEIHVEGPLDADAATAFRDAAEAALASPARTIVLRAERVSALDSSGVGAIVFLHRRLALQERALRVEGLSGQPLALARLIRLDAMLTCQGREAARVASPGLLARVAGALRPAALRPARA